MKIIDMTVNRYVKMEDSDFLESPGHEVVVVQVHTDAGVTGTGFIGTPLFKHGFSTDITEILLKRNLRNLIIGENPLFTERIWKRLFDAPWRIGMRGMIRDCIAAVDFALWDIKGKLMNVPVSHLLGDFRESVLTYANVGHQLPPEELGKKAAEYVERGHTAVKIRCGANAVSLVEATQRVAAVREAIGPKVKLLVDCNGTWDTDTSIQMLREWEPYNVFWLEEPVPPEDISGYARIRERAGNTFIVGGEQNSGLNEFRQLLDMKALDIIQPNASAAGGITEWLKIYNYANMLNIPVSPWNLQQIHLHMAIGLPNVKWIEYFTHDRTYFQNALLKGPVFKEVRKEDGIHLLAPDCVGLGLELDEALAEETLVKSDGVLQ